MLRFQYIKFSKKQTKKKTNKKNPNNIKTLSFRFRIKIASFNKMEKSQLRLKKEKKKKERKHRKIK